MSSLISNCSICAWILWKKETSVYIHFTSAFQNDRPARQPFCSADQFFCVLLRSKKLFTKTFPFHFDVGFFFYCCSVESRSNLKILHNSNTVTTQFICGSWKPGNTAYFFHPVLQNPFYCFCHLFWESTFIQMYYLLVPMFKGNYFYSWNISLS